MKLKGIELKGTYKVEFYDEFFEIYNEKGRLIYFENNEGDWTKWEYNENGNEIYTEDSDGHWSKIEYDEKGNMIYYENSNGYIDDNRVKELTVEEIEKLLGFKIKIKGESK